MVSCFFCSFLFLIIIIIIIISLNKVVEVFFKKLGEFEIKFVSVFVCIYKKREKAEKATSITAYGYVPDQWQNADTPKSAWYNRKTAAAHCLPRACSLLYR